MGPKPAVERFAELDGASRPSTAPPEDVGTSPDDARRDGCMSLLASAAADLVAVPERFDAGARALDEEVPGASRLIRRSVTPELVSTIRDRPDHEISAALGRFGDEFRGVCRAALANENAP